MKKIFALLLSFALMMPSAMALSVDVKSLTDDELLSLKDQVLAEIETRHLEEIRPFGQWFDFGLGALLPKPQLVFGRETKRHTEISFNDDSWFNDNVAGMSQAEFEMYVAAIRLYGFDSNISASSVSFEADKGEELHILISFISKVMFVDVSPK